MRPLHSRTSLPRLPSVFPFPNSLPPYSLSHCLLASLHFLLSFSPPLFPRPSSPLLPCILTSLFASLLLFSFSFRPSPSVHNLAHLDLCNILSRTKPSPSLLPSHPSPLPPITTLSTLPFSPSTSSPLYSSTILYLLSKSPYSISPPSFPSIFPT